MKVNASPPPQRASIGDSELINGDCVQALTLLPRGSIHLTFFDPPFNQGKKYEHFDDGQDAASYWKWIELVLSEIREISCEGAAIYFMQREKNSEQVLRSLRKSGWVFQNMIIWKKKTSAVPSETRFGKQYQIIAYAINGRKPRVFNKLRVDAPLPSNFRSPRADGVFVTDVWDDIRELTSGYFAGSEALRNRDGNRVLAQQSPLALLVRIVLSSSLPGDTVLDPTAGSGAASVAASQLGRRSVSIEIDRDFFRTIQRRLSTIRIADEVEKLRAYYRPTRDLASIWPTGKNHRSEQRA